MLCQPKNKCGPHWQRIRRTNVSLREITEGRLIHSHSSRGRGIVVAYKMFSNDFPALAYLNTSQNVNTYSISVSLLTNGISTMDEPSSTDVGIRCPATAGSRLNATIPRAKRRVPARATHTLEQVIAHDDYAQETTAI